MDLAKYSVGGVFADGHIGNPRAEPQSDNNLPCSIVVLRRLLCVYHTLPHQRPHLFDGEGSHGGEG
jgi:hypothetical protein